MDKVKMALPLGTILHGRYRIINVHGGGGFGIVYGVSDQKNAGKLYAIKEYYPRELVVRSQNGITLTMLSESREKTFHHGEERFLEEAEMLERCQRIRNVVSVYDFFQENGTCYFVMENLVGQDLHQYSKRLRDQGRPVTWKQLAPIIAETGKALSAVHAKGIFHRDIKPNNIYLTDSGTVKLIDFGLAKSLSHDEDLSVHLTKGFAAPEQYFKKGIQGTWTDVYGLAATIYSILSGNKAPEPSFDKKSVPMVPLTNYGIAEGIWNAVRNAMAFDYRKRTQTVDRLMKETGLVETERRAVAVPVLITRVNGKEDFYELKPGVNYKLGRSADIANIVLNEPHVSKLHCELFYDELERVYYVVDHSSTGTYVGNRRIVKDEITPVRIGTTLYFGSFLCQIEVGVYEQ